MGRVCLQCRLSIQAPWGSIALRSTFPSAKPLSHVWAASGTSRQDAPEEGLRELERRHNTHRNTTENTTYFIFLASAFVLISPTTLAAQTWLIGFGVARLGYTYSYLAGKDNARGAFMTLSLLAMYGIASYLVMSLVA